MTFDQSMNERGFEHEETGGGCTWYVRTLDNGQYIAITIQDDPTAPESMVDAVQVTLNSEDGEQLTSAEYDHLYEYFAATNNLNLFEQGGQYHESNR